MTPADDATRLILLAVVWAMVLHRVGVASLEFLLAHKVPPLRWIPLGDARARSLFAALRRILVLGVYGYFLIQVLDVGGVDTALIRPLKNVYGLALLASGIVLVLKERKKLQASLAGFAARPTAMEKKTGAWHSLLVSALGLWWVVAIAYLVGLYLVWASAKEGGFAFLLQTTATTALTVGTAAILLAMGRKLLERLWRLVEPLGVRYPDLASRMPRYRRGLRIAVDTTVIGLAACFALGSWGVSVLTVLESATVQDILRSLLGILIIGIVATACMDFATIFSQRYLEGREREGRAGAKVRTLVPLIQKALRVVIVVLASIMVLEQAGIRIGPILTGVGILGLAVGFGAQTLVKDIITGFFILLEDTCSVGDVIMVNGTGGLVEAIGIRTVRLRDLSGNVHTIPYSSVGMVTNMTKDFSMYLIEASVAYGEDVDEVISVLEEIDEELRKEPEFGVDIQKPIEILGLDRFEDSAVIVRARLTTKPIQQWRIGREFNRRMKKAFDQRGIEIPFPHRTIYFGNSRDDAIPKVESKTTDGNLRGAPSAES